MLLFIICENWSTFLPFGGSSISFCCKGRVGLFEWCFFFFDDYLRQLVRVYSAELITELFIL